MTKRERLKKKLTQQFKLLLLNLKADNLKDKTIDDFVEALLEIGALPKGKTTEKTAGSEVWDSYKAAYDQRYPKSGIAPNALTRTQCKRLAELVGKEAAIPLVAFFVLQNDSDLVRDGHPLNYLVAKYQKFLVRMRTGRTVTQDFARKVERVGASADAGSEWLRRKHGN